jgi:sarcosine oxidase, subunit gamma
MSDTTLSNSDTIAQMDQLPQQTSGLQPRAESPLHHADLATLAAHSAKAGGVELKEVKLLGHLVLRGSIENDGFLSGVKQVLGLDLPGPLQSSQQGEIIAHWVSPDEWLVLVPGQMAFELERDMRSAMSGNFAIVNVSGGQTVIRLSGANAADVLKKSTPYDVHNKNFPVGKAVTSVFAKTQALIVRSGPETWELIVRRSFSDYVWLWLQDACIEYGLVIRD